jgi:hypothetical protein
MRLVTLQPFQIEFLRLDQRKEMLTVLLNLFFFPDKKDNRWKKSELFLKKLRFEIIHTTYTQYFFIVTAICKTINNVTILLINAKVIWQNITYVKGF